MALRVHREPLELEKVKRTHEERMTYIDLSVLACCCALQRLERGDPRIPEYALGLATQLGRRYTHLSDLADVIAAADLCRWGLEQTTSPGLRAALLDEIGEANGALWTHDRRNSCLDEALVAHHESAALRKTHNFDESHNLYCRAEIELKLALCASEPSNITFHESLELFMEAASTTPDPSSRARYLTAACHASVKLYEILGENTFDNAVMWIKEAIGLMSQENARYGSCLASLGMILWKRFQSQGIRSPIEDLEEALDALQDAQKVTSITSASDHRFATHVLGWVWLTSFEQTGNLSHLDEAMKIARDGMVTHKGTLVNPSTTTRRIQFCLRRRYDRLGIPEDLDECISLGQVALDSTPRGDPERSANLGFLSSNLLQRYTRSHAVGDLINAMEFSEESVTIGLNDAGFATCLRNLGEAHLHHVIDVSHDVTELAGAIATLRRSLAVVHADDYIGRIEIVDSLAAALRVHGEWTKSIANLEEAVAYRRDCLADIPSVRPDYPHMQALLADDLFTLHALGDRPADLHLSIAAFRNAIQNPYGNPRDSLECGKRWIKVASQCQDSELISEAYRSTIGLLPRLAYSGYNPTTRLHFLRETPELAVNAANHALASHKPTEAVELLEQGRSVLWNRALQHRYHFRDLPPSYSSQLNAIAEELQRPVGERLAGGMTSDREMSHRRGLIDKFDSVLNQIRQTPGFEHYLLPKAFDVLQLAASFGAVVILLAGQIVSSAIIVKSGLGVQYLPLPITATHLAGSANALRGESIAARNRNTYSTPEADRLGILKKQVVNRRIGSVYNDILGDLWRCVAYPMLTALGYQVSSLERRISIIPL
jgi:tetratricopeptide (TPR) repeat protein